MLKISDGESEDASRRPRPLKGRCASLLFFTSLIRYKGDKCARLSCTRIRARDSPFRSSSFASRPPPQRGGGHPRQRGMMSARGLEYRPSPTPSTRAHIRRPHTFFIYNFALIYAAVRRKSESRRKVRQKGSTWLSVKRDTD